MYKKVEPEIYLSFRNFLRSMRQMNHIKAFVTILFLYSVIVSPPREEHVSPRIQNVIRGSQKGYRIESRIEAGADLHQCSIANALL